MPVTGFHVITDPYRFNQGYPPERVLRHCATMDCPNKPIVCVHVEWNTGNTEGISFFDTCADCLARQHPEIRIEEEQP